MAGATPPNRRGGPGRQLTVLRTATLTPRMVRVVLGGGPDGGLDGFPDTEYTDRYVKLIFPRPGVDYPEPFDVGHIRETMPREQWPLTRTYTVRALDLDRGEMTIDFVVHGDTGLAGPWAQHATPGDTLVLLGPGGAYAPDADADGHVLVGDAAALPAIAAAAEQVPAGRPVHAVIEVDDPDEEQTLTSPGDLDVTWLYHGTSPGLADALRKVEFPSGDVQVFAHGESAAVKELRAHLLEERGLARERVSISGYWRRGADEDTFQAEKRAS